MPRTLLSLFALIALLCATPLHAQDDPIVGTWEGIEMAGEEMPAGEFMITFSADGTGSFSERGFDGDAFTFVRDGALYTISMEGEEAFAFEAAFDGETVVFTPADDDGPPPLTLRRVEADGDGEDMPEDAEDAMPELADMSDSPLVGRWELVSFNGETLPEGTRYVFHNHADGTGTSTVNGEPADPYTWQHDFETGVATFTHPDQEPAEFTFDIEGDTATYVTTDGSMTIIERRVADEPNEAMPDADTPPNRVPAPEPEPIDMSDSPLVGLWMLVKFNEQDVPEDAVVYEHRPDGTGTVIEEGERGVDFRWNHDVENGSIVVHDAQGQVFEFTLVMQDELVFYVSIDETMRIVHRRAGDLEAAADADPIVGTWMAVSMGDEPMEPGDLGLTFHADGTGELDDGGEENEPFTYAYNSATELYSIQVEEEEPIIFAADFDGDELTITPVDEEGPPAIVLRRVAEEDNDADNAGDEGAMDEDGVVGTWYAQKMEGEWVPADEEFRLEFRDDGMAVAYENGDPDGDEVAYTVDEERGVIQIFDGGRLEMELGYEQFDDVMILTFREVGDFDDDEMQILLCRRPEGTEEHQRERAAAQEADEDWRDGAGDAVDDAADAAGDAAGDAIEDAAE